MTTASYFEKEPDGTLKKRNTPSKITTNLHTPSYFEKKADGTLKKQSVPLSPPPKDIKISFAPTPEANKRFYRRVDGELKVFNKHPESPSFSPGSELFKLDSPVHKDSRKKELSATSPLVSHLPVFTAKSWECPRCTFFNEIGHECEMCGASTGRTDHSNDSDDNENDSLRSGSGEDEEGNDDEWPSSPSSWGAVAAQRGGGADKTRGKSGNKIQAIRGSGHKGVWRKTKKLFTRASPWAAAATTTPTRSRFSSNTRVSPAPQERSRMYSEEASTYVANEPGSASASYDKPKQTDVRTLHRTTPHRTVPRRTTPPDTEQHRTHTS